MVENTITENYRTSNSTGTLAKSEAIQPSTLESSIQEGLHCSCMKTCSFAPRLKG